LKERLAKIRLLVLDVDGIMTDGCMYYGESGEEMKKFNFRDGYGIRLLKRAGIEVAIVTLEDTRMVERRAAKLQLAEVHQGITEKGAKLREIKERLSIPTEAVAYMGDDLFDLPAFAEAGLKLTVPDAVPAVRKAADFVTEHAGGTGAVREVAEMILQAQGRFPA